METAHHDGSALYVSDPHPALGAVVRLRLRTHRDHQPAVVLVRRVFDGEPFVLHAEVESESGADVWWAVDLTVRNPVTRYRWLLSGGAYGFSWLTARGLVDHDVPDATDFILSSHASVPEWSSRSIVYQVFPDRFARSAERDQLGPATAPAGAELPAWAEPRAWTDPLGGRSPVVAREYFGGDLDGVREHLDHIQSLGADTVYLTPVFPAGSTHRYDASSFSSIDPLLGGDEAMQRLVREAHARGMKVLGDITLNHCGVDHEWFRAAQQDPDSEERGYFRFDEHARHGYEAWWDIRTLPKFDHTSSALRRRLVTDESAPVRRWVRGADGLDGWRVDVANMAGRMGADDVTHEFMRSVRSAMGAEGSDLLLLAEHGHDASDDLLGDGWHGTMNYSGFSRPVTFWLRGAAFDMPYLDSRVPTPSYTGQQMVATIQDFQARLTWPALLASWNILSSHDSARIRSVCGSAERQGAALALVVGLPGTPMVFAGDEIGAEGLWGEDARTPFPWQSPHSWDKDTLATYRALLDLRRTSAALRTGGLRWIEAATDHVAFLREHPDETLLVVVARGQSESIRLRLTDLGASRVEHLYGFPARLESGYAVIDIPSAGAGIWRMEGA